MIATLAYDYEEDYEYEECTYVEQFFFIEPEPLENLKILYTVPIKYTTMARDTYVQRRLMFSKSGYLPKRIRSKRKDK